jgi:acetyl-CoA carboxylase biotin carboxyl carrier protein
MNGPKDEKRKKKAQKTASDEGFVMPGVDVAQLEHLLDFMAAHDLEEFEYEHGGLRIRLRKGSTAARGMARNAPAPPAASAPVAPSSHPVASEPRPAAPVPSAPAAPAEEFHIIKSPIVGTFYAAASPDAPPFVKVGDEIQVGQVVCIIEAMKLMNEIDADVKGEVVRVLVENSQPVEYGQPLFAIRPAASKK